MGGVARLAWAGVGCVAWSGGGWVVWGAQETSHQARAAGAVRAHGPDGGMLRHEQHGAPPTGAMCAAPPASPYLGWQVCAVPRLQERGHAAGPRGDDAPDVPALPAVRREPQCGGDQVGLRRARHEAPALSRAAVACGFLCAGLQEGVTDSCAAGPLHDMSVCASGEADEGASHRRPDCPPANPAAADRHQSST